MIQSPYVIIGAGLAADAAVRGIRDVDPDGAITVIGDEADPPYKRPLLSKALWHGKPLEKVWTTTPLAGVDIRLGRHVRWVDLAAHEVVDDRGDAYRYEKLLFATGSRPVRFPIAGDLVAPFRSLVDYQRLRALADHQQRIAVIGGGFIGSELASSLAANGKSVSMIFPADTIGDRLFPRDLGVFLNDYYREKGVTVLNGQRVIAVRQDDEAVVLRLQQVATGAEQEITVDGAVAGIGSTPNVELAQAAGLTIDNGIVVDEFLRTSHQDVFAAGDVAEYWQSSLGVRRRVEHEDNAKSMGRSAGRTMAGHAERYRHLPFFYSDLFEMGYEAVGEVDNRLEIVADWTTPNREGVIYYMHDDRVRGVLLWNVWDQVKTARELIESGVPITGDQLCGRLPVAA
jgi:3-phenylpropionate/trans-cinnamate dioxygenase ferredoxin reductase component